MTPQEALKILEDAARTGCPGKYERQEEYWEGSVLPALAALRAVVEEREKKSLIPCLHDAPEYVTAEYFKERYPHPSVVGELRRRVRYCRLCGADITNLDLMVIGGPR